MGESGTTVLDGLAPGTWRVAARTLVIRGRESTLLSAEGAAALCAELPRAKLVEIAAAGHNVHIEQPEAVLAALLQHLRGDEHSEDGEPSEVTP